MRIATNQSTHRWRWFSVLLAFIGLLMVFTQPESVGAAPIRNAPKTTVLSENRDYQMGPQYSFIPEFTSNTRLVMSHGDFKEMEYYSPQGAGGRFQTMSVFAGGDDYRTIDSRMRNGQYSARYTNVGYYNGTAVDLVITIKDWDRFGYPGSQYQSWIYGPIGHVSFAKDRIAVAMQGFNYVDYEWKTVRAGTNTPINTSGYYTFNDVDFDQYVGFSETTWANDIDQLLVENNNNRLMYHTSGSGSSRYHRFAYEDKVDIPDERYDNRHAFTLLYSDTATLNVRWGVDTELRQRQLPVYRPVGGVYNLTRSTGDLMMYTPRKPLPTTIANPTKTQSASGGLEHNEVVTYRVSQSVPYEYQSFYYKSFELRDPIDDVYAIQSVKVFDENNKDVSGQFNISTSNNLARAVAKDTNRHSFYNKKYTMEIKVKLDANRVRQKLGADSNYKIQNTAESRVNGKTRKTPTTVYSVPKRTITVKHIDDKGNNIVPDEKITSVDGLTYNVKPRTNLKNDRGHTYRHIRTSGRTSGTVNGNETVTFVYDEPREVTVEHRTLTGRDQNLLLGKETVWEYDGEKVTAKSKYEHFRDDEGYFYRPRVDSETITVKGASTIILRYDTPRTVTVKHLDKDDDRLLRETYIKGIYDGETYTAKPLVNTLRDVDGYLYRPVENHNRVGLVDFDMTIEILYERPRIIEILHKDNDSGALIQTDIHHKRIYDTDGYEIFSRANEELKYYHEDNDTTYFYYPLNPYNGGDRARLTGTVIEAEVDKERNTFTLEFFYTKPALDLGLTYIRIDTARVDAGLPVKLEFEHEILVPERWEDNTVTLTVYDRDEDVEVYKETDVDVADLVDGMTITVDSDHRKKGTKAIYEAVLSTNNKQSLVTGFATHAGIDTHAYVASERVIKGESVEGVNTTVSYEGVAMTERHQGEDIKEYHERMTATVEPTVHVISGYGYESKQNITFETDVDDHSVPEIKATASAHPNIADGAYEVVDGLHTFDLIGTNTDGDHSRESDFHMPNVYVNRKDGKIFLEDADLRVDGGQKVYVPIWVNQLGNYKYNVQSNRMGRNHVKFDLDQNVTIDAYMFGHIDSETLDDDALLIEPAKTNMLDKWFGDR